MGHLWIRPPRRVGPYSTEARCPRSELPCWLSVLGVRAWASPNYCRAEPGIEVSGHAYESALDCLGVKAPQLDVV
jgi:hypothetical protein